MITFKQQLRDAGLVQVCRRAHVDCDGFATGVDSRGG